MPDRLIKFLKLSVYYYLIFFMYIGILISLSTFLKINLSNVVFRTFIYIVSYILTYFFNKKMWKMWKSKIKEDDLIYQLIFNINNKAIKINAFVDTGNSLKDSINNMDIFIIQNTNQINQDDLKNNQTISVEFNTVNSNCKLKGYIVKNIQINKNYTKVAYINKAILVFVADKLSGNSEYSSLISYETYMDKIQGVLL